MRIVLDAMGTDEAPSAEVAGAIDAMRLEGNSDLEIVLVGDEVLIHAELASYTDVPEGIVVHHAPDRVTVEDSPASVIRRKPRSSIVVGLTLHKEGAADAFVSAGSTGAVMASSLFALRPLPGVERPPVGTLLPTAGELCLLLDAGANIGCKPRHLLQFAHLGTTYMRDVMDRPNPRVGLLNIGEEPGKGDELSVATFELLQGDPGLTFIGNIEGRDIIGGGCDVIVCDGFVGTTPVPPLESVPLQPIPMLSSTGSERIMGARRWSFHRRRRSTSLRRTRRWSARTSISLWANWFPINARIWLSKLAAGPVENWWWSAKDLYAKI